MDTRKMGQSNVVVTLHRPLTAEERLKFGVRPYIGKNTYIVPNARLDELMMHLNSQSASTCEAPNEGKHTETESDDKPTDNEGASNETKQPQECGGDGKQDENAEQSESESKQERQENAPKKEQKQEENAPQEQEQEQQEQQEKEQEQKTSIKHEKFDAVMKILQKGEAVYLYGQAGTGKNHLCAEVAKALGIEMYFTNCVQDVFQLKGFVDAKGDFQKTQLYQAYTKGGLFLLDEMDASDASAPITMNALLANGYMEFPGHTEKIYPHPNFKVVACGNTLGKGADEMYTGRNVIDQATLDRFTVVPIDYDIRVEQSIADNDLELVQFCRKLRNIVKEMQYNMVVSYRTITRIKKYLDVFSITEALEYGFTNAIHEDDAVALSGAFANSTNKYGQAFYKMFSNKK